MIRSAEYVVSAIAEPPNPRLITGTPGKSGARVVHIRIEELPTNSTASRGGGCVASFATSWSMSACQDCGGGGSARAAVLVASDKQHAIHASKNFRCGRKGIIRIWRCLSRSLQPTPVSLHPSLLTSPEHNSANAFIVPRAPACDRTAAESVT